MTGAVPDVNGAGRDAIPLRRLPASWLAIGAFQVAKEFAFPIVVALVTRVRDGRVSGADAAVAAGVAALVAVGAVLRWRHVRWGIGDDRLVVVRGTFGSTRRELPLARIAGVSIEEPLLWRLAGLARLRVRTAAGAGDDAVLDAVPRAEVATVRALLTGARADAPVATVAAPVGDALDRAAGTAPAAAPEGTLLHRASTGDLALAGLTGGALAGIAAILAVAQRALDGLGLEDRLVDWLSQAMEPRLAALGIESALLLVGLGLVGVFVVALPLAAVLSVVRHAGLTVTREGATLARRAGLLDRSDRRIALATVQGVRLVAPPLQRALAGAALRVGTTGLAEGVPGQPDAGTGAVELVPLVRGAARARLAEAVLPGSAAHVEGAWSRVASVRVALLRALLALACAGAATAATAAWAPLPARVAWAAWLPVAVAAWWAVAHVAGRANAASGAAGDAAWLAARWGGWTRVTALARASSAEVAHRRAGPLQRRAGVCTLEVALGDGTSVVWPDVPVALADALERRVRAATTRTGAPPPGRDGSPAARG